MAKYAVGDNVQLKSGGPGMVVFQVDDNPTTDKSRDKDVVYECVWFSTSNEVQTAVFREAVLVPYVASRP